MKLIKSPLNYVGGKSKLLPKILPLFPSEIDTFVDLFGGGFNVGSNVQAKHIIYNEFDTRVYDIIKSLCTEKSEIIFQKINEIINKYELSKTNKEGYIELRQYYNNSYEKDWITLFVLGIFSFNNVSRFNKKGEFNTAFGKDRSYFNTSIQNNLKNFTETLYNKDIQFSNKDYTYIKDLNLTHTDLIYCDPPYLITGVLYGSGWTEEQEYTLLETLDILNKRDIKFALSNVLEHKGKSNDILKQWAKKYNIHYLNHVYTSWAVTKNENIKNITIEVLITNF